MKHTAQSVRIGSIKMTPEELKALQIRRDYKLLREAAGWSSDLIKKKDPSILKDFLGDDYVTKKRNERTAKQRQVTQLPLTGYSY